MQEFSLMTWTVSLRLPNACTVFQAKILVNKGFLLWRNVRIIPFLGTTVLQFSPMQTGINFRWSEHFCVTQVTFFYHSGCRHLFWKLLWLYGNIYVSQIAKFMQIFPSGNFSNQCSCWDNSQFSFCTSTIDILRHRQLKHLIWI